MNCDQVFDVLTRGPFPSGDEADVAVERHLESCHDCCMLAEALRPATDLFHEAMSHEESSTLPGYHGERSTLADISMPQAVATMLEEAVAHAQIPATRVSPPAKQRDTMTWPLFAVVGSLLIAAGMFIVGQLNREKAVVNTPTSKLTALRLTMATHIDDAGKRQLAALSLPAGCLPNHDVGMFTEPSSTESGLHQCCTRCHASGSDTIKSDRLVSAMASSCSACHRPQHDDVSTSIDLGLLPTNADYLLCCL